MAPVETHYTILRPGQAPEKKTVTWPEIPGYHLIKSVVEPIVGDPMEHVTVLYEGRRADMFVDELGHIREKPQPRNEEATTTYRANWLRIKPGTNPESLNCIVGTAIIFDRIIWK